MLPMKIRNKQKVDRSLTANRKSGKNKSTILYCCNAGRTTPGESPRGINCDKADAEADQIADKSMKCLEKADGDCISYETKADISIDNLGESPVLVIAHRGV